MITNYPRNIVAAFEITQDDDEPPILLPGLLPSAAEPTIPQGGDRLPDASRIHNPNAEGDNEYLAWIFWGVLVYIIWQAGW